MQGEGHNSWIVSTRRAKLTRGATLHLTASPKQRLTHIDCMRGLACIIMFQTHCYDSWLGGAARSGKVLQWAHLSSTLAAPSFLFLAGVSVGLGMENLIERGAGSRTLALAALKRGAMILLFGMLFRVQEFALAWPYAPWTDLFRVDVLNVIGASIMLLGLVCWIRQRYQRGVAAAIGMLSIALLAPLLWTSWRPYWLPWFLESYVNGVHIFNKPQPWLFPIFPWAAFCFAGLAASAVFRADWAQRREALTMALTALAGVLFGAAALALDALPIPLYSEYDFWHTSPNFFLVRLGILLIILAACYAWSRRAGRQWIFSILLVLGQSSLLVYWVHIEFVYGRFSLLPKRASTVPQATAGLFVVIIGMFLLASARVWWKRRQRQMREPGIAPSSGFSSRA